MAPTVWTADGLEKKPVAADRERGPIAQFCENLQNKRAWTAAYVFFTAYALFSIDIDALAGDKSSKVGIAICTTFVALAFLLELIVHGMGKEGYIYSAFFILDLVAFISLIPDTIIFQIANDDNAFVAGRSSRLTRMLRLFGRSARAARLNRFGRIARIAALMPKIQELQRYWVHQVEDQDATRVLEKKIYRIFCFLDEDMDSYISKSALRLCRDKLFDLARIENSKKTEWTSKLRMLADAAASARISVPRDTTHLALAIPNGLNKSTRPDLNGFVGPCADSKPFPDQVEYIEFRDSLMNEPPLYEWLKNSVVRQLKRGQNVQALRQRNAEYIGVKVAMAILIIILVLSYVELLTEDTSLSWGFERLNAYVKLTIGTEAANQGRSGWPQQVITWGKQNEWGRPDRPLLYLDLQRQVYCNSLRPNGVSCSSPLSETTLWQQRKTLNEVDQDVSASPYRTSDLLLLRYPEFSQQDVDISAEELENQTEAVALFLNRVDTQASARDSIFTTWGVLLLIMGGITLLTRDLNYLSKNLLKPLVELSDEVESITRLQLAATTNADDENQPATSEIRLLRRRFNGMKTAIRSWGKYVPWPVVQLMMRKDAEANIEVSERQVTMFFSDIASFTTIVESIPPEKSLLMLSRYFQEMSKIVDQHGGIVVEFIGDAILCIYGAPVVNDKHATVAVMAAVSLLKFRCPEICRESVGTPCFNRGS
ncbi:Adenylate cyclase 1 (ATP pyrophosphate-lyase 1) (Adenylyl cyclase 1) [Durusdinium trenchii]|uniref:Adenylate cyclase 1 (ATP pyrophosphate-lyase 1) (Adenylyl cyclase 1) n=1 Tax=Durusdinium trenchii TaxID=1381693 RepID=A0ABP0N302_9DINO